MSSNFFSQIVAKASALLLLAAFASPLAGQTTTSANTARIDNLITSSTPVVDVRSKGAKCDGSTDDTVAIQSAITAATAIDGEVFIPALTCITGALTGAANISITGVGKYLSTLKLKAGANADLLTFGAVAKWQLSNLTLDGNGTNQTATSHVLRINNTSGTDSKASVSHVFVTNGHDDGIHIDTSTDGGAEFVDVYSYFNNGIGVSAGSFDNKWIGLDIGQSGLQGLLIGGSSQHFTDLKSWFSGRITAASGNGVEQAANISKIQCVNCEAQDNQAAGFVLRGSNNTYVGIVANSNSQSGSALFDGVALTSFTSSVITGSSNAVGDLSTFQRFALNLGGSSSVADNYIRLTANANVSGLVTGASGPTGNDVYVLNSDGTVYQHAPSWTVDGALSAGSLSVSGNSVLTGTATASKLGVGGFATGQIAGDGAFSRATTQGIVLFGTDGNCFFNRNGSASLFASGCGTLAWGGGSAISSSSQLAAIPASLTTTAATSDNVTVTGATSSSHCTLTPTNASAATNIATSYVSAKTTNQITVTHTATASMTYDIFCSAH